MTKDLTIVLPLKDRAELTSWWLDCNYNADYSYLVLDGSLGDENEKIFSDLSFIQLKYIRCPPDFTVSAYIAKIESAANFINTKYVMMSDNDDIINYSNVDQMLVTMNTKSNVICTDSKKYCFNKRSFLGVDLYSMPTSLLDYNHSSICGVDGLQKMSINYRCLYYGVFTIDSFRVIWKEIKESGIDNIFLIEMMHSFMAVLLGVCHMTGGVSYFRLLNTPTSSARSENLANGNRPHYFNIVFDHGYRRQVDLMVEILAKIGRCEVVNIRVALENYYCTKVERNRVLIILLSLIRRPVLLPKSLFRLMVFLLGFNYFRN